MLMANLSFLVVFKKLLILRFMKFLRFVVLTQDSVAHNQATQNHFGPLLDGTKRCS